MAFTTPSSLQWNSVTYGNDRFVAVTNNNSAAAYSADGITWTQSTLPESSFWQSVTYGNGIIGESVTNRLNVLTLKN
jgi:hypothetical protein